jgi:puromycin-sensitive aminopeptidase
MVMSTYLVAFVVGPLEATDPVDVDGRRPAAGRAPAGQGPPHRFALEVGAFCLDFFAEYFDIPYPATSSTWSPSRLRLRRHGEPGCVTFREVLLLIDPETATQPELNGWST